MSAPEQADVDVVRDLLAVMSGLPGDDQRARFLLSSNWLRDRGAARCAQLRASQSLCTTCGEGGVQPAYHYERHGHWPTTVDDERRADKDGRCEDESQHTNNEKRN